MNRETHATQWDPPTLDPNAPSAPPLEEPRGKGQHSMAVAEPVEVYSAPQAATVVGRAPDTGPPGPQQPTVGAQVGHVALVLSHVDDVPQRRCWNLGQAWAGQRVRKLLATTSI